MIPLDAANPIALARAASTRWSYFHTHTVAPRDVQLAIEQRRSIEFDVYCGQDGVALIQHPPTFYTSPKKKRSPPCNMDLEAAIRLVEASDKSCVVVLDAKSRAALDVIRALVARLGTDRTVVHAFVRELAFSLPIGSVRSQHWDDEDQCVDDVLRAAAPPGSPCRSAVMLTCRHVTPERLVDPEFGVLERIEREARGADVVGLWLPGGVAPPAGVCARLLRAGLLVTFNADSEPNGAEALPAPCVAMTDHLERSSVN